MSTIKLHRDQDELDQLLHDFFKSEMPRSFPKLNLPEQPMRRRPPARGLFSSRFALAASILLLMLGSLFLSGVFKGFEPSKSGAHKNDVATPPDVVKPMPMPK